MARYELWDLASGNQLNDYSSLIDAVIEVQKGIQEDGAEAWYEVGLLSRGEPPVEVQRIASGPELVAFAERFAEDEALSAASKREIGTHR
jgi:hypothetical protein